MVATEVPLIRVPRGERNKECKKMDCSGVMRTVTFRSEIPVWLAGLEFFSVNCGQCEKPAKYANLTCNVSVSESTVYHRRTDDLEVYHPEKRFRISAVDGENLEKFVVKFEDPVLIPRKTWTDVSFEITGPPQHRLSEGAISKTELKSDDGSSIEISVLRGSKQLSAFLFLKPDQQVHRNGK